MAKWVDLDDDEVVYCGNRGEYENYNIPTEMVEHSIDAVPVIRCKDCKYWDEFPSSSLAPEFHKCKGLGVHTVANFFCSKGERKTND